MIAAAERDKSRARDTSTTISRSWTQRSSDISFTSQLREPIATFIVADQAVMFCQFCEPVPPDRAVPFEIAAQKHRKSIAFRGRLQFINRLGQVESVPVF
jgi:hypothetical protein